MMRRACLVLSLLLMLVPGLARAQTAEPARPDAADRDPNIERKRRAYALMQEGKSRFDLGKFDEAIDLFQKAYEVYPYPEALYSIAQAHRMKKDYERAVFFYKSYLRNEPGAQNRAAVEARIQEMERLDAEQKASAKKPPQGVRQPPSPDGNDVPPDADAEAAPATGTPAVVVPPPASSATSDLPAAWYHDTWGWTLVGGGLVAVAGGSWLVVDASRQPRDQLGDNKTSVTVENAVGWSAVGLGGVALALGIVKLVVTDKPGAASDRAAARGYDLVVGSSYVGIAGSF